MRDGFLRWVVAGGCAGLVVGAVLGTIQWPFVGTFFLGVRWMAFGAAAGAALGARAQVGLGAERALAAGRRSARPSARGLGRSAGLTIGLHAYPATAAVRRRRGRRLRRCPGVRARPRSRSRHGGAASMSDTRAKLLSAAAEALRVDGVAGLSARSIATRAGVNQALIFYHFKTVAASARRGRTRIRGRERRVLPRPVRRRDVARRSPARRPPAARARARPRQRRADGTAHGRRPAGRGARSDRPDTQCPDGTPRSS